MSDSDGKTGGLGKMRRQKAEKVEPRQAWWFSTGFRGILEEAQGKTIGPEPENVELNLPTEASWGFDMEGWIVVWFTDGSAVASCVESGCDSSWWNEDSPPPPVQTNTLFFYGGIREPWVEEDGQ